MQNDNPADNIPGAEQSILVKAVAAVEAFKIAKAKREFNLVRVDKEGKTEVEKAIAGTTEKIGAFYSAAAKLLLEVREAKRQADKSEAFFDKINALIDKNGGPY